MQATSRLDTNSSQQMKQTNRWCGSKILVTYRNRALENSAPFKTNRLKRLWLIKQHNLNTVWSPQREIFRNKIELSKETRAYSHIKILIRFYNISGLIQPQQKTNTEMNQTPNLKSEIIQRFKDSRISFKIIRSNIKWKESNNSFCYFKSSKKQIWLTSTKCWIFH